MSYIEIVAQKQGGIMQTIKLNNDVEMPILGFGTFLMTDKNECEHSVINAIQTGYKLIDTARAYGNEDAVGAGIKNSGIKREELFITTKINFGDFEKEDCEKALKDSFEKLQLDYIDMVLLHWPFGNTYAAYRVLENFYEKGLIRAIGVSNYMPSQLIDLIKFNKIVPAVNQIEVNLHCQQKELREINEKYNVETQAYAPLGQGKAEYLYELPILKQIAEKHNKTPRQIALKFLIQNNISVIPKTVHIERIKENFNLFDFKLDKDEIDLISKLDKGKNLIGNSQDTALAEFAMTWV